jgi:hypothetical protein
MLQVFKRGLCGVDGAVAALAVGGLGMCVGDRETIGKGVAGAA